MHCYHSDNLMRHLPAATWVGTAGVPYELGPEFLAELFSKHAIDYVVHGDDPCLLPDGTDAYAYAKKQACALHGVRFFWFAAA